MINILAAVMLSLQSSSVPSTTEIEQLLVDRAIAHRANPVEVLRVARCENTDLVPGLTNYGGSGAIGIGQWMPGRGNHWDRTPAWRVHGIDIHQAYRNSDPSATYYDVDMFAWSFGPEALQLYPYNRSGWSCY